MGLMHEVHVRISSACFERIESIAANGEVSIAALCRQALWQYVRGRLPDDTLSVRRPRRKDEGRAS